jgi:hypothetical protein
LRGRLAAIGTVRRNQFDTVPPQLLIERIAVAGAITNRVLELSLNHVEVKAQLHQPDLIITRRMRTYGGPAVAAGAQPARHAVRLRQMMAKWNGNMKKSNESACAILFRESRHHLFPIVINHCGALAALTLVCIKFTSNMPGNDLLKLFGEHR